MMIITTSQSIEGYRIAKYCGIVLTNQNCSLTTNEKKNIQIIAETREAIEIEIGRQASELGGNAVIALAIMPVSQYGNMLATGTAVVIDS